MNHNIAVWYMQLPHAQQKRIKLGVSILRNAGMTPEDALQTFHQLYLNRLADGFHNRPYKVAER